MKKVLFLFAILCSMGSNAQIRYYKDSSFTQAYTLLSGATSLNNGLFWDDDDFTIPIGFNFKFFGDSSNTLYHSGSTFSTGGQFSLKPITFSSQYVSFIAMTGSDIRDKDTTNTGSSKSPISYQTSGVAPNRIFKLQFQNAGFVNAIDNGNFSDSISIQLWLYETSNMIDIRFGPSNLVSSAMDLWDGGPGPFIGIFDSLDYQSLNLTVNKSYFLNGSVIAPVIDSSITSMATLAVLPGMTGKPSNGSVYRFMPRTASTTPTNIAELNDGSDNSIYYDPARQELYFNVDEQNASLTLYDLNGRPLFETGSGKGIHRYSLTHLSSGMYIARWTNGSNYKTIKIVKTDQ
jgi:hypothetical protein